MDMDNKILDVSKSIFNFCKSRTASTTDAEDLSQEILLELCRSVGNLRSEEAFYGFMWSVANNVYRQWYRRKSREPSTSVLDEDSALANSDLLPEEDEMLTLLRRELGLLHKEYRHAVILYYVENKSCLEISRLLGISESMVKYLLFKSRKILKEGMTMERTYGEMSYNPKSVKLMFWFWKNADSRYYHAADSKIAQNILFACYNDQLRPEQISLEIGVALPYLEDDLENLCKTGLLIKEGPRYLTNILLITDELKCELRAKTADAVERIADIVSAAVKENEEKIRAINFAGNDMSFPTLAWQISALILYKAVIDDLETRIAFDHPKNEFGTECLIWGVENADADTFTDRFSVGISNAGNNYGDSIRFVGFPVNGEMPFQIVSEVNGSVNLLCEIAKGGSVLSENDKEILAELIRRGYVRNDNGQFAVNMPAFTTAQFHELTAILNSASSAITDEALKMMTLIEEILKDHAPNHLKTLCRPLAYTRLLDDAISAPVQKLCDRRFLLPCAVTDLFPTTFILLNQ